MSRPAIEVSRLSKRYVIEHEARHDNLRDTLHHTARKLWRRWRWGTHFSREEFWALREVSLEVQPGEVVGVIGRNGAGKSTLLKILARITEATTGRVTLRGRVASLLEVGTGFHPELTGRENIFLNGAILGMQRAEIRRKFDEIVAFAETERFLDTPVKRYSSGMYVRLAFAVAAHLEPEILIVDEVLAVGDAAFQKKCLGKMGEVSRQHGRTVLFVSHNMVAVKSLCQRTVLLQDGAVHFDGDAARGTALYLGNTAANRHVWEWPDDDSAPGNDALRIRRIQCSGDQQAQEASLLTMQSEISVVSDFRVLAGDRQLHITYHLLNDDGVVVLTTGSGARTYVPGTYRAALRLPANLLNSGGYHLKLLIVENGNRVTYSCEKIASFTVVDRSERRHGWHGREPGVVQPKLPWEVTPLSP